MEEKTKRLPPPPARAAEPVALVLVQLTGKGASRVYPLEQRQIVIGRAEDAGIRIDEEGVSRKHVKLIRSSGGLVNVLDLDSTNGAYVNGQRVDMAVLRLGDLLELGSDVSLKLTDAETARRSTTGRSDGSSTKQEELELTDRQVDIARLVAEGLTNAAIARRLGISPRTVTSHLDHIYTRLGISSRAALTAKLAAAGLLRNEGAP